MEVGSFVRQQSHYFSHKTHASTKRRHAKPPQKASKAAASEVSWRVFEAEVYAYQLDKGARWLSPLHHLRKACSNTQQCSTILI